MTFDPDWPHGHLYNGKMPARVVCTYAKTKSSNVILALIRDHDGAEFARFFSSQGNGIGTPYDLINAPAPKRKIEFWVNVNCDNERFTYNSKIDADDCRSPDRIACLHIVREYEPGDGL